MKTKKIAQSPSEPSSPKKNRPNPNDSNRKHSPVDFSKDRKHRKGADEATSDLRRKLLRLLEEKSKSFDVQRAILQRVDIKMEKDDNLSTTRVERLIKLGEPGLHLEQITVEVEKRYEAMFVGFNSLIDSLKNHITTILNEQKKEFFNSLLAEKTQNSSNFNTLITKLNEVVFLGHTEGRGLSHVKQSLEAFKLFFKFSDSFKEDFYGMISSKLVNFDLKNIQNDVAKFFSQILSQSLLPPTVFPTELIRFFEQVQEQSKTAQNFGQDCGNYLSISSKYPSSVQMNLKESTLDFDLHKSGSTLD